MVVLNWKGRREVSRVIGETWKLNAGRRFGAAGVVVDLKKLKPVLAVVGKKLKAGRSVTNIKGGRLVVVEVDFEVVILLVVTSASEVASKVKRVEDGFDGLNVKESTSSATGKNDVSK